jgi:hypothetical protein
MRWKIWEPAHHLDFLSVYLQTFSLIGPTFRLVGTTCLSSQNSEQNNKYGCVHSLFHMHFERARAHTYNFIFRFCGNFRTRSLGAQWGHSHPVTRFRSESLVSGTATPAAASNGLVTPRPAGPGPRSGARVLPSCPETLLRASEWAAGVPHSRGVLIRVASPSQKAAAVTVTVRVRIRLAR